MNGIEEPVVCMPETGETLEEYLQRYTVNGIQNIFAHPGKYKEFCRILLETPWLAGNGTEEKDLAYQKLWKIIQNTENYNVLLHHIKLWAPSRRDVLQNLSECADELKKVSNICTIGRIIGCTAESLSTILGLGFTESKSENWLNMATLFGGLGFFVTLAEMKISTDKYYKLMKLIERDQKLFAPIQTWYRQSEEIEKAMKDVFPFDFTEGMVKELSDVASGEKTFDPVNLLSNLLAELVKIHKEKAQDRKIFESLIHFISCSWFKEICEWIVCRETHPVVFEITKMVLQSYYSPVKFIVCQRIGALATANRNLYSIPVMGRLLLNGFCLVNDISRLYSFKVPGQYEMKDLEKQMRFELQALNRIAKKFSKMNLESTDTTLSNSTLH